jgi:hypothetical protein
MLKVDTQELYKGLRKETEIIVKLHKKFNQIEEECLNAKDSINKHKTDIKAKNKLILANPT